MIRVDGKMTDRIGFLEDLFGVKIRYTTNADEMRLIAGRIPAKRKNYFGCYDADSRMVHLFLRSGKDCTPSSVDATVLFHLVGAKGLKGALGRKNWEAVCERVARAVFPGMEGEQAALVSAGEGVIIGCGEGSPRWKDIAAAVSEVTGLDAGIAETLPSSQAHYERTSYNEARKEKDLAGLAEAMRRGLARQEGRTMMVCSCGPMGEPYRKAGFPEGMELMLNVGKLNGFLRSSGMDAGDIPTEKLLECLQRPLALIKDKKFGNNLVFTDIRTLDGGFLCVVIPSANMIRGNMAYVELVKENSPSELIGCLKHKENIVFLRLSEDGKTSEVLRYLDEFRKADPNSLYKKGDPAEHPNNQGTDSITRDLSLYTKVDKKSESASKSDELFEKYGIKRNADGQLERHKPYRKGDPAEHPSMNLTDSITRDLSLCTNVVKDFESASRADELYAKFGIKKKTEEKFDLAGAVGKLMAQEAAEAAAAAVSVQSVRVRPLSERQKTPISEKWFTPSTVRKMNGAGLYSAMDLFVYGSGRVRDTFGPKAARDMERFISAAGLNLRPVKVTKTAMADIVAENINALPAPAPSLSLPMPRNADGRFFDGPSCISLLSAMALNEGRWGSCGVFVSEEDANVCSLALLPDAVPCRVDSVAGEVKVYNLADTTLGTVNPEALSMLVDECMNNPAQTYYLNVMESLRGSAAAVVEKFFRYMAAKPRPYEPDMKPTPLAEALVNAPDLRIGKPFVTEDENDIVMKADSDIEAKVSAIRLCLAGSGAEVATVEDAVPVLRAAGATPEEAESVRAALAAGVSINGVSLANGRTVVIADNIGSEEQLRLTFIHERTHRYLAENPALVESLAQEIEPGTEGALLSSLLPDKDTLTVYEGKGWKAMVEEAVCYAMEKALSVKAEDLSRTLSRAGVSSLPFIDFIKREDTRMRALLPADPFRREPDLTPDVRMDIWAGPGGSHRELSNMAQRPFELGGQRFTCVEQCFQYRKAQLAGDAEAMRMILASGDGFEAKRLGSGARGLDVARWDAVKEEVMKEAMRASFEQNPDAAAALLATGNATLTHEKDHRWSEAFPRLLTEVRMEMRHGYDIVERKAPGVYLALRHNPDDGRMWAYVVDAAGRSLTGFSPAEMETMHLEVSEDGGLDLQAHAHYDIQGPDGLPQKKLVVSGPAFHIVPDWEAFMKGENLYRQSVRGLGIDPDLVKAEFMPLLMHERKDEPVTVEEMPDGGTRQSYEFRRINDTLRAVTEFSADGTKRSEYTVLLNEWGPWKTGWDIEYDGEGRVSALRTVDYISSLDEETRSGALRFTPEGRVSVLDTYREIKEEEGNFEFPCEQLNDSVRTHFRIRQLAPNGRKSNLTPQLYDYVRTPEFIGRYGDWMHGDAHTPLDGNGEPLVLWHGSMASFDRFDLSHAGDNTGIVEYTDRRTGENILSDSDRAMFFTSDRNSAISYAFLAKTQEAGRIEGDLRDIASLIRTGGKDAFVHRIKSRKQLLEEVEFLRSRGDVFIDNALGFIDTTSERPISSVPESLRDEYAETVLRVAKTYGERYRLNDRGGLSNRQNNISGQMEYLKYFRENIGRLCANDAGVKTEHDGDFLRYVQSFFSADGGYGVSIHFVDGRMKVYGFREGPVHLDEFTDDDRTELLGKIESDLHACAEKYNETLRESGFGKATHLYPVFLHTEKPLEHDYRGSAFPDKYKANERYGTAYVAARQVQKALREGNDAVVYRNVMDPHMMDTYGVFSADQIEMIDAEKYGLRWELSPELFMSSDEMKEAAEVKARTEAVGKAHTEEAPERAAEVVFSSGYRKGEPQASPDTAFLFTENAEAADYVRLLRENPDARYAEGYGTFDYPHKAFPKINVSDMDGRNSAGIRTDGHGGVTQNAFGIIVKKYQQDAAGRFVSQEGCFEDTDRDFELFRKMNERVFEDIAAMNPAKIVLPRQMGLGKAALPLRFCEWLGGELATRYGVESEVKRNLTAGYEGYGLEILGLKPMENINMEKNMEGKVNTPLENKDEARRLATDTAMFLADKLNSVGIRTVVVGRDEAERALREMSDSAEFSVADIQRLNYEWNGESISLKVFAQTFGDLIKQKDRTVEDVERIAKAYINSVKENPSAFIPQLKAEKMSHWRYFVLQDGSIYTDTHMLAQSPEYQTQRGLWSIYSNVLGDRMAGFVDMMKRHDSLSVEERAGFDAMEAEVSASHLMQLTLEVNAQKVNERRNRDVANLIQYFDDNTDYTSAEKAIILKGVMTYSYSEKKKDGGRNEVKLVRITDANDISIPVIGGDAASVVEGLRKGLNFKDSLILARSGADDGRNRSVSRDFTGWKVYPKSDREEDAVVLNRDAAGTGWCTGGSVSTARTHLSGGDFHIYFENGEPLIAIRTENGRLAEAPRGAHEGQFCNPREEEIAFAYIREGHGIEGGSEYVADMEDLRRLNDPGCTWRDIVMMPSVRRYENGEFGGDTKSWGEVALAKMRSLMRESREERFAEGYYTPQEMAETGATRDLVKVLLNDETFKLEGSWTNLEHIKGNIKVTDNTFLSNCKSIGGDVGIISGQFTAQQLSSIGGGVEVAGNFTASQLGSIGGGVEVAGNFTASQLSSIGGDVEVAGNFTAPQLSSIGGDVRVYESGRFDAQKLASIGGDVDVYESGQFSAPKLGVIGGNVNVRDSGQFKAPQLESIGGCVRVYELAHFEAPKLNSIGGSVTVHESGHFEAPQLLYSIGGNVEVWNSGQFKAPKLNSIGGSVTVHESGHFEAPQLDVIGGYVDVWYSGHFSAPKLGVIGGDVEVHESGHFDTPQLESVEGDVVVKYGQGYFNAPLLKRDFHLQDGTVYGYEYDNTIYLAPEGINPNTPIHEYAHLWAKAMQRTDPQKWAAIKEIVRGSEVWEQIQRSENYAFIRDDEDRLAEEALATAVGDSGENILLEAAGRVIATEGMKEEDRKDAVVEELKDMINGYVTKDLFEINDVAGLDLSTITLGVIKSLVEQKNLNEIKTDNTMDIEKKIDDALSEFRNQHEIGFITEDEMNGKAVDFITEALGGHATAEQLDDALSRNGYASAESILGVTAGIAAEEDVQLESVVCELFSGGIGDIEKIPMFVDIDYVRKDGEKFNRFTAVITPVSEDGDEDFVVELQRVLEDGTVEKKWTGVSIDMRRIIDSIRDAEVRETILRAAKGEGELNPKLQPEDIGFVNPDNLVGYAKDILISENGNAYVFGASMAQAGLSPDDVKRLKEEAVNAALEASAALYEDEEHPELAKLKVKMAFEERLDALTGPEFLSKSAAAKEYAARTDAWPSEVTMYGEGVFVMKDGGAGFLVGRDGGRLVEDLLGDPAPYVGEDGIVRAHVWRNERDEAVYFESATGEVPAAVQRSIADRLVDEIVVGDELLAEHEVRDWLRTQSAKDISLFEMEVEDKAMKRFGPLSSIARNTRKAVEREISEWVGNMHAAVNQMESDGIRTFRSGEGFNTVADRLVFGEGNMYGEHKPDVTSPLKMRDEVLMREKGIFPRSPEERAMGYVPAESVNVGRMMKAVRSAYRSGKSLDDLLWKADGEKPGAPAVLEDRGPYERSVSSVSIYEQFRGVLEDAKAHPLVDYVMNFDIKPGSFSQTGYLGLEYAFLMKRAMADVFGDESPRNVIIPESWLATGLFRRKEDGKGIQDSPVDELVREPETEAQPLKKGLLFGVREALSLSGREARDVLSLFNHQGEKEIVVLERPVSVERDGVEYEIRECVRDGHDYMFNAYAGSQESMEEGAHLVLGLADLKPYELKDISDEARRMNESQAEMQGLRMEVMRMLRDAAADGSADALVPLGLTVVLDNGNEYPVHGVSVRDGVLVWRWSADGSGNEDMMEESTGGCLTDESVRRLASVVQEAGNVSEGEDKGMDVAGQETEGFRLPGGGSVRTLEDGRDVICDMNGNPLHEGTVISGRMNYGVFSGRIQMSNGTVKTFTFYGNTSTLLIGGQVSVLSVPEKGRTPEDVLVFTESDDSKYNVRTRENARACDVTVAFATDFTTAGEVWTAYYAGCQDLSHLPVEKAGPAFGQPVVPKGPDKYIACDWGMSINQMADHIEDVLCDRGLRDRPVSLNIAGNGIYTFAKEGVSQEAVDDVVYRVMKKLRERGVMISSVRSGGQTGADEAGAKAGVRLHIPTEVHAPKGYLFRDAGGKDISGGEAFRARFDGVVNEALGRGEKKSEAVSKSPIIFTSDRSGVSMVTLDRNIAASDVTMVLTVGNLTQGDADTIARAGGKAFHVALDVKKINATGTANGEGYRAKDLDEIVDSYLAQGLTPKDVSLFITGSKRPAIEYSGVDVEKLQRIVNCIVYVMKEKVGVSAVRSTGRPGDMDCYGIRAAVKNGLVPTIYAEKGYPGYGEDGGGYMEYVDAYLDILPDRQGPSVERSAKKADDGQETETKGREKGAVTVVTGTEGEADVTVLNVNDDERLSQFDIDRLTFPKGTVMRLNGVETKFGNGASIRDAAIMMFGLEPDWGYNVNRRYMSNLPGKDSPLFNADMMDVDGKGRTVLKVSLPEYRDYLYDNALYPLFRECMKLRPEQFSNAKAAITTAAHDDGNTLVKLVDREGFTGRLLTDFMCDAPARNVNLETGEVVADAEAVAVERERPKVDYTDGPRVSVSGLNKMSEVDVSAMIPEEADTVLKIGPNKGGRKGYLKKDSLEKVVKASGAGDLQYLKPSAGGDGAEAIRTAALNGKNVHLLVNESDPVKCPETYGMLQELNASGVKVEWISKGRGDAIRQESQSEVIERAIFPKVILQGSPEQLRFNALREIIPDEGVVVDTPVLYRKENEIFSGRFNFGNEMRIEPGRSTNQEQNCADIAKGVDFMLSFGGRNARKLESGTEARRMSNVLVFKDVMGADLNLERLDDAGYAKTCARKFIDRMIEKMTVRMYAGEIIDPSALSLGFTGMTGAELAVKPYFRKSASEEDLKMEGADVSKSNIPAMDELVGITATNMATDYGMTVHEESDRKKSFGHSYSQVEFSDLPNADFSTKGEMTPLFTFLRNFLGYLNDPDLVKSIAEKRGAASLEPNAEFEGGDTEEIHAGHVEVVNVGAYENKVEGFLAASPGNIYIGRMKGSPKVGSPLVYDGSMTVEDFVRSLPDPSALIRIGGNILGNPFTHKDGTAAPVKMMTREQSVQAYSVLFDILYGKDSEYTKAVDGIYERLKNGEDITLGCWCKPAPCHGDVLKQKLSEKLDMEMRKSAAKARRAAPVFHVGSTVTDGDNGCNIEFSNASAALGLRTSLHPTKDYKTTTIDGSVMGFSYKGRRLRDGAAEAVFVNRTRLGLENEVTREQLLQKAKDSMELFMEERQAEQPGLSDRQAFALHFAGVPDGDIAVIDALCRDEVVADWKALSAKVMDYYGTDEEYEALQAELEKAEQRERQQAEFIERYARSRDAVVKVFADEMEKHGPVKSEDIADFLGRVKTRVKDEEHAHMPVNLVKMIKETCKGELTAQKAVGFIEEFDRQVKNSMENRSRAVAHARNAVDIYSGPAVAYAPEALEAAALEADADVRRHAENGQAFGSFKRADYPAGWLAQRSKFFETSRIEVRRHTDGSISLGPKSVTVNGETVRDEGVVDHIGEGKDVDVKVASRELDSNPLFFYSQGPLELLDRDLLHVSDSHSGSDEDEKLAKNLLGPALRREGIVPVLSVDSPSMEGRTYLKSATNALASEMMDNGAETVMFVEDGVENSDVEDLAARNVRQGGVNISPVGNSAAKGTPGGKRQTTEKAVAKLCRASAVLNATGVPYLSTPFDVAVLVFAFAGKLNANMEKAREARESEGKPTFTFTPDPEGINQAIERAKEVVHVKHVDIENGEPAEKVGKAEKITRPNYDTIDVVRYEDKVHLFVDGTHENVMETVVNMFGGKATIHDTSVERNAVRSVSETLSRRAVTMKNPVDGSVEEFFTERGAYVSDGAEELIKPASREQLYFVKGKLYDLATVPELPKGLGIDIEPKEVREQTLPAFDRICDVVERAWEKVKADPNVGLDCDVHTSALHPVVNRIGRELKIMEGDALRCRVWIDRGGNLLVNESSSLVDDMGDEEGHAVLTDKLTGVQGSERRNVNLVDRYTRKLNLSMVEAIGNQIALALTSETSQEKKVYGLMERDEVEEQEDRRKFGELKKFRDDNLTRLSVDLEKGKLEKAGEPFSRTEAYAYVSDMLARKDAVIAGIVRQIEKMNKTVKELEHLKENCKVNDDFYINMEAYDSQITHAVEERDALLDAWRKAVQERVDLNETRERLLRARNVTSLDGAPEGTVKLCIDNVVLTVEKAEISEKELKKAESRVKAGVKRWSAVRNMEKGHTLVISEETVSMPESGKAEKKPVDELEKKIEEFEKYLSENEKAMAPAAVESLKKDIASLMAQRKRALAKAEKDNPGEGLENSVLAYDLSRDNVQKTVRDRYIVAVEGGFLLCRPDGTPVNNEVAERYKPFGHDFWFVSYPDGTKNIINSEGLKFCDMNVKEVMQYKVGQDTDMLLVQQTDGNYNILNLRTGHLVLRDPATGQVTGTPVHPKICGNWVEITASPSDGDEAFHRGKDGKPLFVKVDSEGNYIRNTAGQYIPAAPGELGSRIPMKTLINVEGQRASSKWMSRVEYVAGENGKRLARFILEDGVQVQFDTDIKILKREDLSVVNNEGLDRSRGITRADAAKK